jgi:hypothetical protein
MNPSMSADIEAVAKWCAGTAHLSLSELHNLTPHLDGPTRLVLFHSLPERIRRELWDNLAAQIVMQSGAPTRRAAA